MWLVVDNGAGTIKYGLASDVSCSMMPNCIGRPRKDLRTLVGPELESDDITHHSNLLYTRPHERGYLTNLDVEIQIWDYFMEQIGSKVKLTGILVTLPPFCPKELTHLMDEMINKHFGIKKCIKRIPAELTAISYSKELCIVVDSGFSFTHVIPVFDGKIFRQGVQRIDVGGKLLTNYLKEMISYGQINVSDETYIVEQMKKQACYVSLDIKADMKDLAVLQSQPYLPRREKLSLEKRRALEARFIRRYVLPDYDKVKHGYIVPQDTTASELQHLKRQTLTLSGELFLVPELLFNPSNIGLKQAGLPEVIERVVGLCPIETRALLRQNILLSGGNTLFTNFSQRLSQELGPEYKCSMVDDPLQAPWLGGKTVV